MRPRTQSDVAVVGAGPAGSSVAIALARAGYDVALVERQRQGRLPPGEVLAASARVPLDALGLWSAFLDLAPMAGRSQLSIWGQARTYEIPALFDAHGAAWHIDRCRFDTLLRRAATEAGARLLPVSRLTGVAPTGQGDWTLQFDGRQEHDARFVVDASGRSRTFARKVGAAYERDDQLLALLCCFGGQGDELVEAPRLLVEAAEIGWWYAAPLPGARWVVALMTDSAAMASLGLREAGAWRERLERTAAVAGCLPGHGDIMDPVVRLANSGRITPAGGANWLAVGDAALSHDPLAGQGVLSALWSGLKAAEAISHWFHGRRDPLLAYLRAQDNAYRRYLELKGAYYRLERRWPESPFWRARHEHAQGRAA